MDFAPTALGPYTLLAPLAQGGMGAVHFALKGDAHRRSLILIKTLKSSLVEVEDYAGRFLDEAKVALRLRHKNLCEVFDAGNDGGTFYIAMELIEGVTFKRLMSLLDQKKRALSTTESAALVVALLRGLHAAHVATDENGRALGVVHRDVSPHNTMLDVNGRVKVIDYGLATSVLKETFTESMVALGKSAYMPPEQARGEDVTPASDQYSAAIVFYELLTGDRFYGDLSARSIWGIAGSGTHKPRSWERVPAHLRAVLQRALSPSIRDRHASCAAFADAIVDVESHAADSEALPSLRRLVKELAPPELAAIAEARAMMARIDDVTEKAPVADRTVRVDGATFDRTEIVRDRRLSSSQSGSSSRKPDDTASTLVRPRRTPAAQKSRAPIFAGVGVGAVIVAALGVGAMSSHSTPPTAPAPVAASIAATIVAPVAPVAPPSPPSATTTTIDVAPPLPVAAAPVGDVKPVVEVKADDAAKKREDEAKKRERLARSADAFLKRVPPSTCPQAFLVAKAKMKLANGADLQVFERTLHDAEKECSSSSSP